MAGLWGDGWFYLSGGGFLVSGLLFVFLLGQYRAAIEAEEQNEEASATPAPAAERVYVPRPIEPIVRLPEPVPSVEAAPAVIAPVVRAAEPPPAAATPAPAPVAVEQAAPKPAEKKRSEATTTGGLSPAVVYLQNLKTQVDHLDKELAVLKDLASRQATQGEQILGRLAALGERLEAIETPPPAAVAQPVEEAGLASAEPQAEPELVSQAPAPVAEELRTVVLQPPSSSLPAETEQSAPAPAQEPAAAAEAAAPAAEQTASAEASQPAAEAVAQPEPEPEPKPVRKGPVWPI